MKDGGMKTHFDVWQYQFTYIIKNRTKKKKKKQSAVDIKEIINMQGLGRHSFFIAWWNDTYGYRIKNRKAF